MADKRLIDAGELIGYLHEKTFIDGDDRSMVYKAIEEQPTIEVKPDNDWISVKDRLPADKARYLICVENQRVEIAYYQPIGDKFSDYEPFWQGRSCRFTTVTRWQPLPELPKGE